MNAIKRFLSNNLTELAATGYFFLCVGVFVLGIASCKCPPGELDADERTPKTAVECYDQAYQVVRECRERYAAHGGDAGCLRLLDDALNLCDRHYGQPYHNGNHPGPVRSRSDDTGTGDDDAL